MSTEQDDKSKLQLQSTTIRRLPAAVRAELDDRIIKKNFGCYRDLRTWLRERGCLITTMGVKNYANKLEERLAAIRIATDHARAIVEATDGDDVDFNEAMLRLVQQHLFMVLVDLNGVGLNPAHIPALARSVGGLVRASILQKKYTEEIRSRIAEKVGVAKRAIEAAEARGLSEAGAAHIKRVLMEITE